MAAKTKVKKQTGSEWDTLEDALVSPVTRGAGKSAAAREIDTLFDDGEQKDLRRLAESARLFRSRSPAIGNVVFLHGITGSDLAAIDKKGDADNIWVNIARVIVGRVNDLKLSPDGKKEANTRVTVRPTGVNKKYYAKAILALRARWNVEPFAYDWRKDIDEASDGLAALIRQKFPGQPVHLVAHSLGGLVARNFIRRHPALWEGMNDANTTVGGRLVMLGTPNYGSYAIPPVLTGSDQLLSLLEKLDLKHNMAELLAITNTFVGSYMLLPAPDKLPSALGLYHRDTWGNVPGISQPHLDRTYQFHKDLESAPTIDSTRMVYIAGCRRATIDSMSIAAPGEFEYGLTYAGDGRVPHALGLLEGVPAYYVDEVHGDLARNQSVLRAVDAILETGTTDELSTTALRSRDKSEPRMQDYRTVADRLLSDYLEGVAIKAKARGGPVGLSQEEQRIASDALIKAALGADAQTLPKALISGGEENTLDQRPANQLKPVDLEVLVRFDDVTKVQAPVVVCGHYRGVQPVNAIGAIDKALDGWIARAVRRGMISGQLGETFYVPSNGLIAADGVVVAGMGDYGRFTGASLRQLMANVAIGAAALELTSLATVLVGAGEGALDRDTALRELLEGLGTGLTELREETGKKRVSLRQIILIESNPSRYFQLIDTLRSLEGEVGLSTARIKANSLPADEQRAKLAAAKSSREGISRGAARAQNDTRGEFDEVRITVERDDARNLFRYSALSRSAVVPVREVEVNMRSALEAADKLRKTRTRDEQEQFGRLLYTYLMPEDFQELIDGPFPIRLVVDPTSAALPWEMACFFGRANSARLRWLGTDLGLSRQFKTMLSSSPGVSPPLNNKLRILVIADPAPERELQLPGARAEGRRIVELLKQAASNPKLNPPLELDIVQRIGPGECEPVEILSLLLSGDFDIVHFCGHGDYNPRDPKASGWIFGADRVLTARDIFRARKVPRLVFANACFSGVLRESEPYVPVDAARSLASIAEAFLGRGVPNYIGTGWPVDDRQAVTVADVFYGNLVKRKTIGEALKLARKAIFDERVESTWGAYQLYGNPNDTIFRPTN